MGWAPGQEVLTSLRLSDELNGGGRGVGEARPGAERQDTARVQGSPRLTFSQLLSVPC